MNRWNILACAVASLMGLTACGNDLDEPVAERGGGMACPRISVSVAPMVGIGPDTKAMTQLGPEMENTIKRLDIFQFDGEGMHRKVEQGDYHTLNLKNDITAPDGVLVADITDVQFHALPKTTIVFVANLEPELVDKFYADCAKESGAALGNITLDQFKKWTVGLPYDKDYKTDYSDNEANQDQIEKEGKLTAVYMSGYYEGALKAGQSLNIALGRLPALLDVSFEFKSDITKSIGCHLTHVHDSSHVFPHAEENSFSRAQRFHIHRPDVSESNPISKGTSFRCYYYIGGHTTSEEAHATQIKIYYGEAYTNFHKHGEKDDSEYDKPSATLILSNQGLENDVNRWGLNRNTIYRITVNIHTGTARTKGGDAAAPTTLTRVNPDGSRVRDVYL